MNSNERIRFVRQRLKLSMQKFADSLEMSKSYLSDIELGRSDPSGNFLIKLAETYNVSINWIVLGKGKIFFHDEQNENTAIGTNTNEELSNYLNEHTKLVEQLKEALHRAEKQFSSTFKELENTIGLIDENKKDLNQELR